MFFWGVKDNHLGNVIVTVSDKKSGSDNTGDGKVDFYKARVQMFSSYYPFGMKILSRSFNAMTAENNKTGYLYGYNGKEQDFSAHNKDGQILDYGFRIYDTRIAKFLTVDPLTQSYPELTPYQFASNSPIAGIDIDGLEFGWAQDLWDVTSSGYNIAIEKVDAVFTEYIGRPVVNALESMDRYYYKNIYGAAKAGGLGSESKVNIGSLQSKTKLELGENKSNQTYVQVKTRNAGGVNIENFTPSESSAGVSQSLYLFAKFKQEDGAAKPTGISATPGKPELIIETTAKFELNILGTGFFSSYNYGKKELRIGLTFGAELKPPVTSGSETTATSDVGEVNFVTDGVLEQ